VYKKTGMANEGWSFANPGYPPGQTHILREYPSTTIRNVYKKIWARIGAIRAFSGFITDSLLYFSPTPRTGSQVMPVCVPLDSALFCKGEPSEPRCVHF